jgi:polyisoprenoid-binding protein YceI
LTHNPSRSFRSVRVAARSFALLGFFAFVTTRLGVAHAPPAPASSAGSAMVLVLDPDKSEIHWTLGSTLHTVHGTFQFRSGELRLDPASGKASGEIIVPATGGESGNDGRDKKMLKDVLESSRYQDIVFKPNRVEGKVPSSGTCNVLVHGILTLHGADHEFGVPVQAELSADHWKATAKFTIPFIKWGLKNPGNFFLKVKPEVDLELNMTGTLKSSPGA